MKLGRVVDVYGYPPHRGYFSELLNAKGYETAPALGKL